jgi:hypothetical protein
MKGNKEARKKRRRIESEREDIDESQIKQT